MTDMRDSPNGPRIAIVGSTSPLGQDVCELLESVAPDITPDLIETDEYTQLLDEFDGQIKVTSMLPPDRIAAADVAFLTCGADLITRYIAGGGALGKLTIDLGGASEAPNLFLQGIGEPEPDGRLGAPPADVIVIAHLLRSLQGLGVDFCAATLLLPASTGGGEATLELGKQTAKVLNLREPEGNDRVAFNVISADSTTPDPEASAADMVAMALGDEYPRPIIQACRVPVFRGMCLSVLLRTRLPVPEVDFRRRLMEAEPGGPAWTFSKRPATPLGVIGSDRIHATPPRATSDPHCFRIWITVDDVRLAAANALALYRRAYPASVSE